MPRKKINKDPFDSDKAVELVDRLTSGRLAFANAILSGAYETDRDAYRAAFNNYTGSDATIDKAARVTKANKYVKEYLSQQRSKKVAIVGMNMEDSITLVESKLVDAMEVSNNTTPASRLKAIELYMKLKRIGDAPIRDPLEIPKTTADVLSKMMDMINEANKRVSGPAQVANKLIIEGEVIENKEDDSHLPN